MQPMPKILQKRKTRLQTCEDDKTESRLASSQLVCPLPRIGLRLLFRGRRLLRLSLNVLKEILNLPLVDPAPLTGSGGGTAGRGSSGVESVATGELHTDT